MGIRPAAPTRIPDGPAQKCDSRCRIGEGIESQGILPVEAADRRFGRARGRGGLDGEKRLLANGLEGDLSIDQADQPESILCAMGDMKVFDAAEMRHFAHTRQSKMRHLKFFGNHRYSAHDVPGFATTIP